MKNNSNIYDIDGKLIRTAGDNEQLSIEEAEKRIQQYQDKMKDLEDSNPNKAVYTTYIQNLQRYIFNYYIIHPEEAKARLSKEEEIKKAMEQLKADLDKEETEEKPTIMDEYTDFEEIKEKENDETD